MKVQELKNLMSASDREHLEKAFAESYKKLRKAQKEEIDPLLTAILEGKTIDKKKTEVRMDFGQLEQEIIDFIENAYAQNYFAPNRIIPKSQRSKWRFMVKNFIKELDKIPLESEEYPRAVKLLTDLYRLLCEACKVYLFSTDDPFRSIGWEQPDLFEMVVKKTFAPGYTREDISRLLQYAATGGLSTESLYVIQEAVLLGELKTNDVKNIAVEEAMKLVEDRAGKLAIAKNYNSKYVLENAVNELCGMILMLRIGLGETKEGVEYYFKNSKEYDKPAMLHGALERIDLLDDDALWIKVYEYGVKKKIKPWEDLKQEYDERKARL